LRFIHFVVVRLARYPDVVRKPFILLERLLVIDSAVRRCETGGKGTAIGPFKTQLFFEDGRLAFPIRRFY